MKGVTASGTVAGRRVWTSQEVSRLTVLWGKLSPSSVGREFPGRTWSAVRIYAHRSGLGAPNRGLVSIAEGARRAGYSTEAFRAILERQGVKVRRRWGQSPAVQRRLQHQVVDWSEARAAVERHLEGKRRPRWQWLSHVTKEAA